jgi:hypothetical protein
MSKQAITLLSLPVQAITAITEYRAVTYAGAQVAAADAVVLGIASRSAANGEYVDVAVKGTAVIEAGGVVAVGALVYTDASGRGVAVGANNAIARALQAASAAGDFIEILLMQR